MHRNSWRLVAFLMFWGLAACHPEFQLKNLTTNESLYTASLKEFQRKHWDNAVAGFEKLTTDLPPRDTLLPRSYWYLAEAHDRMGEHLLAAQSFSRLTETFPDDSLADDAALESARSYKKLWRRPELDPQYGDIAVTSYNTLIGLYPNSPLLPQAQKELGELDEMFAEKDYDSGIYYFRRKAWDSANLYFKDVLAKHPNAPKARDAGTKLVQSYKAIGYKDDATDLCTELKQRYPSDKQVADVCRGLPTAVAAKPDSTPAPPRAPPATKPPTTN
ncbi:MAG TPA: outer membrane protein assembly factor BamD [Gemmatimonadaceae bacterium]|nr:outer membrane protein assembly factor BamD [Gemmatimonadaceae bacterium]